MNRWKVSYGANEIFLTFHDPDQSTKIGGCDVLTSPHPFASLWPAKSILGTPSGSSDPRVLAPQPAYPTAAPNRSVTNGYATLTVIGGFSKPLMWGHYWLLRDDPATALSNGGIRIPEGKSPDAFMRAACEKDQVTCKRITQALDANGIAKIATNGAGVGTFPVVPPGSYYLMISAGSKYRHFLWDQKVDLQAGPNSTVLSDPAR